MLFFCHFETQNKVGGGCLPASGEGGFLFDIVAPDDYCSL
jgi:hypothetical protein